jgi:biotin carboxyl carrier protein
MVEDAVMTTKRENRGDEKAARDRRDGGQRRAFASLAGFNEKDATKRRYYYQNMNTISEKKTSSIRSSNNIITRGFAAKSPEDYPPHSVIPFPSLSPTMTQGGIASWAVEEGAKISAGDILAEIQTDKATMEMECMDDGYLAKILVPAGEADDIPIGRAIAVTCENEEDVGKFADYVVTEDATAGSSVGDATSASAADEPAAKAILERPEYEAIKKGDEKFESCWERFRRVERRRFERYRDGFGTPRGFAKHDRPRRLELRVVRRNDQRRKSVHHR